MSNKKNIKVVGYARYSSDLQREESIEAQERAIKEFCDKEGLTIIKFYVDRAQSAKTDDRTEFKKMINDCNKGEFDGIVVHKLDRFARNRYDSAHYKYIIKSHGIKLYSVTERLDDSPESVILESVLEGMAEYYILNLAREVEKGKMENALKCNHVGGIPPLGYDVDKATRKLVINENEAKAVRLIFKKVIEGCSYGDILNELNLKGFKTKAGSKFGKNSLFSILKNEKYCGTYIYNKSAKANSATKKRNGHKYKPEEEISDEQLRQTIVSLYFQNKSTSELVPEGRLIDVKLLLNEPYITLMQLLIDGPKNEQLEKLIPDGTVINKIELKNDILYVDLSKEFIENNKGGEELESNTIYSIVNTMTQLTEVNGVKILIDGEMDKSFKDGKIKFDDAFVRKDK